MVSEVSRLLRRFRTSAGAAASLGLKIFSAGITFIALALAAHTMTVEAYGRLGIWFNILSFAAVISAFGQDGLILRSWHEYISAGRPGLARGAFLFGWRMILGQALVAAALTALVAERFTMEGWPLVAAAVAFIGAQTILQYSGFSCRTICGFLRAEPARELPWRLSTLAVVTLYWWKGWPMTATMFLGTAACAAYVSVLIHAAFTRRYFPAAIAAHPAGYETGLWLRRSAALCVPASLDAASQYAEVILIGWLLGPASAAGYFAASRIANVFPMIAAGVQGYSIVHVTRHHFEGNRGAVQAVFRGTIVVAAPLMLAALALIALFGHDLLALFGEAYRDQYWTLLLLVAGTAVQGLSGAGGPALMLTGHEAVYLKAQTCMVATRIGLVLLLAPLFGPLGAAMALAGVSFPYAWYLVRCSRLLLGADPSPFGLFARGRPSSGTAV